MFRNYWLEALLIWCGVIIVATIFPAYHLAFVSDLNIFPEADLLVHFFLFLLYGILFTGTLTYRFKLKKVFLKLLFVLVSGTMFAAITELLQFLLPVNRSASLDDLIADIAGVLIGSLLVIIISGRKKKDFSHKQQ